VSAQGIARSVSVDPAFVGHEVSLHRERDRDGSVGAQFRHDFLYTAHALARTRTVFVTRVVDGLVAHALVVAGGRHSLHVGAVGQGLRVDVVCALGHCLGLAERVVSIVASCHHPYVLEPVPGGPDLSSVAPVRIALVFVAAGSRVRDREQIGEAGLDAEAVVLRFGGAVRPAGATCALIASVVDYVLALRPLLARVE